MCKFLSRFIPNKLYLAIMYYKHFKKILNFQNPKTFNEKIQWLKLHDHQQRYVDMVDKIKMKEYVNRIIGCGFTVPILASWNSVDEIDVEKLPNKFVLKTNHDSKGVVVCNNKDSFDIVAAKKLLLRHMKRNGFDYGREWPYKNVEKRIFAEEYIENSEAELTDYKVHVFDGVPRLILVCKGRFSSDGMSEDFLTCDWEKTSIHRPNVKQFPGEIIKPDKLNEMLEIAKKLSKGIPFLRVDFYYSNEQIYVGELTFYPASGFLPFEPDGVDEMMGKWIHLRK